MKQMAMTMINSILAAMYYLSMIQILRSNSMARINLITIIRFSKQMNMTIIILEMGMRRNSSKLQVKLVLALQVQRVGLLKLFITKNMIKYYNLYLLINNNRRRSRFRKARSKLFGKITAALIMEK